MPSPRIKNFPFGFSSSVSNDRQSDRACVDLAEEGREHRSGGEDWKGVKVLSGASKVRLPPLFM